MTEASKMSFSIPSADERAQLDNFRQWNVRAFEALASSIPGSRGHEIAQEKSSYFGSRDSSPLVNSYNHLVWIRPLEYHPSAKTVKSEALQIFTARHPGETPPEDFVTHTDSAKEWKAIKQQVIAEKYSDMAVGFTAMLDEAGIAYQYCSEVNPVIDNHGFNRGDIVIDIRQPDIRDKLQALLQASKNDIAATPAGKNKLERLEFYALHDPVTFDESVFNIVNSNMPCNTQGDPLDREYAARLIHRAKQRLDDIAKDLGVSTMVDALSKSSGGWTRGSQNSH